MRSHRDVPHHVHDRHDGRADRPAHQGGRAFHQSPAHARRWIMQSFDTGAWLAYCGACPLPEMANAFERCGIEFRSVSGYLADERAWRRIEGWVRASAVKRALRHGRHGLLGHLYPGMYDVATDLTLVPAQLGGHVEVLEIDDLRVRVAQVNDEEVAPAPRRSTRYVRTSRLG